MSLKYPRKAISTKTRFDIFKRDEFICQYCGSHPPTVILHVDHIVAVAEGGTNDLENLVTSCQSCNLGKGARPLSKVSKSLKKLAEETAEQEKQLKAYNDIFLAKRERIDQDCWDVVNILCPGIPRFNKQKLGSIAQFILRLGLPVVLECAEMSAARAYSNNSRFLYFCKVCWNLIRENDNG